MLKKIGRVLLGILLISLMITSSIYIIKTNKKSANTVDAGNITVVVINIDNEIVSKKRISYNEEDTLYEVVNNEFNINSTDSMYGHYLIGIDDIQTDGKTSWLWFETGYLKSDSNADPDNVDDYEFRKVLTGIDGIQLENNMLFVINERDSNHTTSILNVDKIVISSKIDYFKIIAYVIMGLFLLGIILYFIFSKNNKKMTVRELAILSLMTVIVFVQEELLTVLPNIQLTFLLFAVYTAVFGYRRTTLIVCAHVLLDNMIMGSLTPIVMIPMLIGYMIYISLIALVKNRGLWLITIVASIGSLIYCYLFLVANAIFLDIDVMAYFIADIPFEILLVLSTIFTIVYLYRPLTKKLNELWNQNNEDIDVDYSFKEE